MQRTCMRPAWCVRRARSSAARNANGYSPRGAASSISACQHFSLLISLNPKPPVVPFRRRAVRESPLQAAGVEGEVFGVGDGWSARGGGPDHGRVVRAQVRRWDDEAGSGLRALSFESSAQERVGGDPARYDGRGHVVEIHGPKELAGEGFDDGGLVAGSQVWQFLW